MVGVLWSKIQKALSKEIQREQLNTGDHIYTWRPDNSKSHGIYVGDGEVIHFTPRLAGQEYKALSTSIDNFLNGGKLYLFEYGVNRILFLANPQVGSTCTLFTYTPEITKNRAFFLLKNGFTFSHLYKNNSEAFAVYCKTGLLSIRVSRSELAASILAIPCALFFLLLGLYFLGIIFAPANLSDWAATAVVVYCTCRLASDIGARPDVIYSVPVKRLAKVEVEELGFLPNLRARISLVFSIWVYLVFQVPECITLFCWAIFQGNFNFRTWVLFNKITVDQLQPGDHIYTWRGYSYTHHGIYEGDGIVFHTVRGQGPLLHCSSSSWNIHVQFIEIDEFVCGGELYRYEYGVKLGYFIAKLRGGTCTLASSDPTTNVLNRAYFLFDYTRNYTRTKGKKGKKGKKDKKFNKPYEFNIIVGAYDLLRNNCEDFAIYCKTSLAVENGVLLGRSGQIACLFAAAGFYISFRIPISNLISVGVGYFVYSTLRILADTKYRGDSFRIIHNQKFDDIIPELLSPRVQSNWSLFLTAFPPFVYALWFYLGPYLLDFFGLGMPTECPNHQQRRRIFWSLIYYTMYTVCL